MCACTMCVCVVPPTLAKHPPRVVQGCRCLPTGVGGLPSQLIRCQPGAEVHQRWAAEAEDGDARPIPRPIAVWHDAPAGGPTAVPSRFPFANPKMGLGYMPPALGSVWGRFFSCCQSTAPPRGEVESLTDGTNPTQGSGYSWHAFRLQPHTTDIWVCACKPLHEHGVLIMCIICPNVHPQLFGIKLGLPMLLSNLHFMPSPPLHHHPLCTPGLSVLSLFFSRVCLG